MSKDSENKKQGIIDPPMNVQDAFILQTRMRQMTEAMREATGQIGGHWPVVCAL
ncbi:hypothetical protein [Endozoicomonas sp. ONNA2]|uniref:hypothetical protein n=1 Tax=Endozoicomonas sp. ONNA2 TaxID=2828741 RepID=UPI00214794BE|nr:hypothetical protein [Endozoicomonas sp. ONNA2]